MLQIITGKFFRTDNLYRTQQRTVLYSNYRAMGPIETEVGTYQPGGFSYDVANAVYEVEQCLEAENADGSPGVVVALSSEHLAADFAARL